VFDLPGPSWDRHVPQGVRDAEMDGRVAGQS
jgi:hypothetical protein